MMKGDEIIDIYNRRDLQQGIRVLWVIWAAMLVSLGIYLIVAHLAGEQIRTNPLPKKTYGILHYSLMAVAVVVLGVTYTAKKTILASTGRSLPSGTAENISPPSLQSIIQKYTVATIISLALSESVGIFGLVLYFLGGDATTLYIFIGCSAMAMVFHRPKTEEIEVLLYTKEGRP